MLSEPAAPTLKPFAAVMLAFLVFGSGAVYGQSGGQHRLAISDKGFTPDTLTIPAGQKVQLEVHNQRKLPSEFESYPLNREKLVPAGSSVPIWIGPLPPGRYQFFDDFNPGHTGTVVVKSVVKQSDKDANHAQ